MKRTATAAAAVAAAFWLGGCTEVAQEPGKSYAGKEDSKPYAGDEFKGDRDKWVTALAERSKGQDDYARMNPAKK